MLRDTKDCYYWEQWNKQVTYMMYLIFEKTLLYQIVVYIIVLKYKWFIKHIGKKPSIKIKAISSTAQTKMMLW